MRQQWKKQIMHVLLLLPPLFPLYRGIPKLLGWGKKILWSFGGQTRYSRGYPKVSGKVVLIINLITHTSDLVRFYQLTWDDSTLGGD